MNYYIILGLDYITGPYNVTFLTGRTTAEFTVSVINDNILEVNESFSLAVNSAALPSNVSSIDQTMITITDTDSELYLHLII